ncbi:MAG: histidine kinase N-terminal 7TM domain-containing protein [Dehalococcoidales bacterium]
MILSLIMTLFVVILTWKRRNINGAPAMISLATATFIWTLGFFLESHSSTLESQLLFNNIGYLGSMAVPVAWFVFCFNYTNNKRIIDGWRAVYFCIFPIIVTVLIWTNGSHHLLWSNEHLGTSGQFTVTLKTYGSLFWVALAYNYALILIGGLVLLHRLFSRVSLFTGQIISLLVAVCLPWIWNIIYVFNLAPIPRKDLTPVAFAVSGLAIAIGLVRYQLFTTVPYARKFIIQQMNEGVLVFNANNVLVDVNPKGFNILRLPQNIIGKKLDNLTTLSPMDGKK